MSGILTVLKRLVVGTEPETARSGNRQDDNQGFMILGPTEVVPSEVVPVLPVTRGRLLLAVDATASREPAWAVSIQTTDTLFLEVPGRLDVALAVHGGSRVHTYTQYFSDVGRLRDRASRIRCEAGYTRWLEIFLRATQEKPAPEVIIAIADCFEESKSHASRVADRLKAQGTRVIILQDGYDGDAADVFADIAARSGGAVLGFDVSVVGRLRELLGAAAVLAVGGESLLKSKAQQNAGALLLLNGIEAGKKRLRR